MTVSDYQIVEFRDGVVFIRDMNKGRVSLTNDAENVCLDVNEEYPYARIVYRDTVGDWCELKHSNGKFLGYKPYFGWKPF
jgi:hypothetical protein